MSDNPYAPPAEVSESDGQAEVDGDLLASRLSRLGAAILDGIIMMAILMPVQFLSGFIDRVTQQNVSVGETLLMSLFGMVVYLAINGWTLVKRGQSIGKIAAKIQIVDFDTGKILPFSRVYVFRYLWMLPFSIAVAFIPGSSDDVLVNIIAFVDALIIFGAARRCLHDYIASSKVVVYRPDRERVA